MDFNKVFHKKHILMVFASSDKDKKFLAQMEVFEKVKADVDAHELAIISISSKAPPTYFLRKKYNSRDDAFLAVLIGKDGKVKEVNRQPFQIADLFQLIDGASQR